MTKHFASLGFVLLSGLPALLAQTPPSSDPSVPAADPRQAPSALRAWIFPAGDKGVFDLTLGRGPAEAPVSLARAERGGKSVDGIYRKVAPGRAAFVLKGGEQSLASTEVDLPPGAHVTAVAWQAGEKWQIKLFADPPAKPGAGARPLRVLNFAADRETLLSVGGGKATRLPATSVQELSLPAKVNGVSVQVVDPSGGPASETSLEVDLGTLPLAYAVIGPDYRGRMRPEVIEGGPPRIDTAAAAPVPEIDPVQQAKLERERRAANRRLERNHVAAQIAILEAQIKEGVNVPEGADGIRQDLRKQLKDLDSEPEATAPAGSSPGS